ncbi:hypothetical protein BKA62DRAFT_678440 [Auriculariales sp. MPI-PUGE-AT-0066]|nr:hypothetical protein BKA62DRAFT_678440 [Auriculariales sp. MPI-PUGE-AT-0066]
MVFVPSTADAVDLRQPRPARRGHLGQATAHESEKKGPTLNEGHPASPLDVRADGFRAIDGRRSRPASTAVRRVATGWGKLQRMRTKGKPTMNDGHPCVAP